MVWNGGKTWAVNEPLRSSDFNTYITENLEALKDPPFASYELNEASDYTTTSTTFLDVDGTNLALTITTTGGVVFVGINMSFEVGSANRWYLDIDVDGVRKGGDDGIFVTQGISNPQSISMIYPISGLSAGSHTFKLQWKTSGGTLTLLAGAGTSGKDVHGQLWVREMS